MEKLPQDLKLQNLIRNAKILIVCAIAVSLFFVISILINAYTNINETDTIQSWVIFWIGVVEVLFQVVTLLIILFKTNKRIQRITDCLIFFSLYIVLVDIYFLFTSPQFRTYPYIFIMEIVQVILFYIFYRKTKGNQPSPKLAYGFFAIWIIVFLVYIVIKNTFLQDLLYKISIYKHDYSIVATTILSLLIQYFASFVLCWISCMAIVNVGFYKNFIEARPKIPIQEIQKTGTQD